jgi:phage terminase large subunit
VPTVSLEIPTARWALPLLEPARYKGAKGGRGSGKSHFFAELAIEEMVCDPDLRFVCIREVQRSLKFSAKSLVEGKIGSLGVGEHFEVLNSEIRRRGGRGVMIFEGMQDHTADSLKSLEGFGRAWAEEAQSLSKRSLDLLLPTIRMDGSEIWFSWNPDQPDDPVDTMFRGLAGDDFPLTDGVARGDGYTLVHNSYPLNPFCPDTTLDEAERMRALDSDAWEHIWLGAYNVKSDAKVLAGKYVVEDFDVPQDRFGEPTWDGPYHGADHGFAMDPRVLVRCWIGPHKRWGANCLYVEHESYHVKLGIDKTPAKWAEDVPGFAGYVLRAEAAEPGTNDYLKRHGVPRIEGVKKWQGSVEDGIAHLRHYDKIVIHARCPNAAEEARLYSYKIDKRTGDILPQIEDRHNHVWDSVRYALAPLIKPGAKRFMFR